MKCIDFILFASGVFSVLFTILYGVCYYNDIGNCEGVFHTMLYFIGSYIVLMFFKFARELSNGIDEGGFIEGEVVEEDFIA